MRMLKLLQRMLFCVAIVAMFPSVSLGAVTTCPSGYTTINESDAIYVSNTGSCSAGDTQLGGDMELKNCYTSQNAPMCTYYDEIYTAVYNCNGGSGGTSEPVTYGNTFTPKTNVCTRSGYEFDGWTIDGTTVASSFTWSYLSDKTLTARWKSSCDDGFTLVDGECVFEPEFTITTTDTSDFSFEISAAGTYYLDCGNGEGVRTINKTSTGAETITCANRTSTTIGLSGQATGYSTTSYTAAISFRGNTKIKSVDGSLGAIFSVNGSYSGSVYGGSAQYLFSSTFSDCTSLESIPETLFAGVTGSSRYMFSGTFYGCTSLKSIPENLFSGVSGSGENMFYKTFAYCTSLKFIPEGLFNGVKGNANSMFSSTFLGCTSLESIPQNLFSGVTGSAYSMFSSTFNDCTALKSIPEKLFDGVGAASYIFSNTFSGCKSLTSVPEKLFAGVRGSASYMFVGTFDGCKSLQSIPENLFAGVNGSAKYMFWATFSGCTSLESIPENLFSGVTGSAEDMFYYTFSDCTSLKNIPENLFAGVRGSATNMFSYTFHRCTGLTGYIPYNTFPSSDVLDVSTMSNTFYNTTLDETCPAGTYQYITGFESKWSGKVSCAPCPDGMCSKSLSCTTEYGNGTITCQYDTATSDYTNCTSCILSCPDGQMLIDGACVDAEFTITTTDMSDFSFSISAAGTYYLDCGNGEGVRTINKTSTGAETFTCTNRTSTTIGLSGQATEYSSNSSAISFSHNTKIKSVDGSLGAIFGGSSESMFHSTFDECTSLQSIPETLFNGVTGSAKGMFYATFDGCTSLASIPENLFSGVTGSADYMFDETFQRCTSLTTVPENLFAGVTGSAQRMFFSTFNGCKSLKSIPENLFSGVSGSAEEMFRGTFYYCSSLESVPENLFASVTGNANKLFRSTFSGCTSLQSIPENLFSGVTGCAYRMFYATFSGCTSLQSIPGKLFAGVSGSAEDMFGFTFDGCTSLQSIPENLFVGVSGSANYMFGNTFDGCNGLRGYIPYNTFPGSDVLSASTMSNTFNNTTLDTACPSGTYQYITGFESAWSGKVSCAPCPNGVCYTVTQCGGDAGVGEKRCYYDGLTNDYTKCDDTCVYTSCNDGYIMTDGVCVKFEPEFTITTTSNTSSFSFQISAAGNYTISWGDGNVEQISKSNVTLATYSHNYNTAGKYEINISGQATGYNTDVNTPSVSFSQNKNIAKISGSLGAIFGTLSNGDNPRFKETFYACTNMSGPIPADLFAGITGNPTKRMFTGLFSDCSSLSGEIPADLFSGLTGAVTEYMFQNTFYNCKKLTGGIPSGLFRVTGTPQIYMFYQTFRGCTGLTGTIGDGLFAGIKGAPAKAMFQDTFSQILPRDGGTDMNLTGSIPANLFAGISGAPASLMFFNTFYGCSKLSGTIPGDLFKGIKGQLNGTQAFQYTFEKCAGLTGYIPPELFADVTYSGTYPTGGCGDMCDIFNGATGLATSCAPYGLTEYKTVFKPDWDNRVSCFKPEFSITTINMPANTSYKFTLGAAGTYYIDWGDGSAIQTINKTDTSVTLVSHTYASAGVRTIGISGQATGYYTADDGRRAAVGFSWGDNVNATANHYTAKISGSLGAIFGTLPDGTQPRFNYTFYQSPNLTGTIPENLFDGVYGQPISYMFDGTFFKTGLTGQIPGGLFKDIVGKPVTFLFTSTFSDNYNLVSTIPSELFSGIQGAPAPLMFYQTFYKSSKMKGEIPADLFAKIKGAPAKQMFRQTFAGCSGLTGSIPENLFSGIEGAPAQEMFNQTFSGCTGLTGQIPPKLFWGITGMPASNMYYGTFQSCTGLTGNVPVELFGRINNTNYQSGPMSNVFYGSGIKTTCPDGMIQYHTGFDIDFSDRKACWKPDIIITTTELPSGAVFRFSVSAMADYTIDWGDGTRVEALSKKTTYYENLSHKYDKAGTYTIGLMANNVTGYANPNIGEQYSAISFSAKAVTSNTACSYIKGIKGGLGAMFPTLSDGSQPSFRAVFQNCNELEGAIPSDLFKGVSGQPVKYMFQEVFSGCTNLTGPIPSDLFADISGTATDHLFYGLFDGCTGLTGEIPENLFKNISGGSEGASFSNVFRSCSKLTGSIPDKLFANLDSKPGNRVFSGTFDGCSGLTGEIPADLFASVAGAPEEFAFYMTFANCSGLSGEIPGDLFKTIKTDTPQPYMFFGTFQNCSGLTGSIPADLFSGIKGAPAEGMFNDTFDGCSGLTGSIPADLFSGIDGAPAPRMFEGTFKGDSSLTGTIPATLFKGIRGAAATRMFENTFQNCSRLTGYIPAELFGGITSFETSSIPSMASTFYGANSISTSCPVGMYLKKLGVEGQWQDLYNDELTEAQGKYDEVLDVADEDNNKIKAVCVKCPDGFTSKVGADSADDCDIKLKKLHIGDDTLYITPNKPASTPVMAFRVDGTTYYGGLSDMEKTLNDETETKYNVLYNGKHYYMYDATVQ